MDLDAILKSGVDTALELPVLSGVQHCHTTPQLKQFAQLVVSKNFKSCLAVEAMQPAAAYQARVLRKDAKMME